MDETAQKKRDWNFERKSKELDLTHLEQRKVKF